MNELFNNPPAVSENEMSQSIRDHLQTSTIAFLLDCLNQAQTHPFFGICSSMAGSSSESQMVVLEEDDTLKEAVEKISASKTTYGIIKDVKSNSYSAIVDLYDFVPHLCSIFLEDGLPTEPRMSECKDACSSIKLTSIFHQVNMQHFTSIPSSASIMCLIEQLLKPDIERVAVVDRQNVPTAVISRAGVLKFLYHQANLFQSELKIQAKSLLKPTIAPWGLIAGRKEEVTCTFKKIWEKQLLGLADTHGSTHYDKFMNWIIQLLIADLPPEDANTISQDESILMVLEHLSKDRNVIVVDSKQIPQQRITCSNILEYVAIVNTIPGDWQMTGNEGDVDFVTTRGALKTS